jgi:hypothetical protein
MKHFGSVFEWFLAAASTLGLFGCNTISGAQFSPMRLSGRGWSKSLQLRFRIMYVFNADGTMQQANPDAGDKTTSDSDGKGVWIAEGQQIRGKWVEVAARLISSLDVVNSHSTSSLTATAFRDQQCFGLTT